MRTIPALALALVAATALPSGAATPRGVTFTDATGDANFTDGAVGTVSQASLDIIKVRLSPYLPSKKSSGVMVHLDLAAAPQIVPGLSYVFTATQFGCEITVTHTVGAAGTAGSALQTCSAGSQSYHSGNDFGGLVISGTTVTFMVPADLLFDSKPGSGLKGIDVSTAVGEPATGAVTPARADHARYAKTYRVGS